MLNILLLSLLFAGSAHAESSADWYDKIKSQEDAVTQDLQKIRAASQEKMSTREKKERKNHLDKIMRKLEKLGNDIETKANRKFTAEESTAWSTVLQEARSLQDINQGNVNDLESHKLPELTPSPAP